MSDASSGSPSVSLMRRTEVRMLASHPIAAGKSRHIVEQHRLVAGLALIEIHDAADLLLAVGALDHLQLAGGLDLAEPGSQVLLGRVGEALGRRIRRLDSWRSAFPATCSPDSRIIPERLSCALDHAACSKARSVTVPTRSRRYSRAVIEIVHGLDRGRGSLRGRRESLRSGLSPFQQPLGLRDAARLGLGAADARGAARPCGRPPSR